MTSTRYVVLIDEQKMTIVTVVREWRSHWRSLTVISRLRYKTETWLQQSLHSSWFIVCCMPLVVLYGTGPAPDSVLNCFLPARRYASAGNSDRNVCVCPSVRPSVCPSHAGIVSKRKKLASWFLHCLVAPTILVFWCQISSQHSKGFPRAGASNKGGVGKSTVFYL